VIIAQRTYRIFPTGNGARSPHALLDVELQDGEADPSEGGFGCGQLLEDFHAESRLLDHPANPSNLTFNPVQPRDHVLLMGLVEHGILAKYPDAPAAPRIPAASPVERAAIGYLHGNCGHCHNEESKLRNVELFLRYDSEAPLQPALTSTVRHPVRKPAPGQSPEARLRIEPGHPERSALAERIGSRHRALQMPPLGTELVDHEAVDLIRRWIADLEGASPDNQE
jgi:hypothetical protein